MTHSTPMGSLENKYIKPWIHSSRLLSNKSTYTRSLANKYLCDLVNSLISGCYIVLSMNLVSSRYIYSVASIHIIISYLSLYAGVENNSLIPDSVRVESCCSLPYHRILDRSKPLPNSRFSGDFASRLDHYFPFLCPHIAKPRYNSHGPVEGFGCIGY